MSGLSPFSGELVRREWAQSVASPAYDGLTRDQRIAWREDHPDSYLHVTRTGTDEPDAETVTDADLIERGRTSLDRLLARGAFHALAQPAWHVYGLERNGHRQLGLVGEFEPGSFFDRVRPHEATQPDRAAFLALHTGGVGAVSSPIALTMPSEDLASLLAQAATHEPVLDFESDDNLRQLVWRVDHPELTEQLTAAVAQGHAFIIDGHHRAAAGQTLLEAGTPRPLLVAVFPTSSLRVAGFHRLLRLPAAVSGEAFLTMTSRRFPVSSLPGLQTPMPGELSMRVDGSWYQVTLDERPVSGGPQVHLGSLDPVVLQRELLDAVADRGANLGSDRGNVQFIPSTSGFDEVLRVADDEHRIPVLVAPVEIDDIITVAGNGLVLPPKSTYFTPKVRSGVFLRRFARL